MASSTPKNGEWYAFDFEGRKFYARVYNNGLTGHLELTEVRDPYICKVCGRGYQEGRHFSPDEEHEYEARGA